MEIISVTLKNFKAHADRHFVFQPGTNAICGENGAGKTSILEAIAWTLFNHRGAYKNEDLIRNGFNSAQVIVEFVSNRDDRTYSVKRCTASGYTIFDPQLNANLDYKRIDEEILPWLRQHLGVAPGTDLAKLFANTIGVPQGTFTADFLLPAEKRKPIFDAVLRVEEYRQVYQNMASLEKYGKAEVEMLQRAIAQYDETLQEQAPLQERHNALAAEIAAAETQLATLQHQLISLQAEKDQLAATAQQVQQLERTLHTLNTQIEARRQATDRLYQALQRSRQAVACCTTHEMAYQTYLHTEATLKGLDQALEQRQRLLTQREGLHKRLAERQTEVMRLALKLEDITQATAELERLQPLVQQQLELEQQQAAIALELQQLHAIHIEQQALSQQLSHLQETHADLTATIQHLASLEAVLQYIPDLEHRRDRLHEQLSRIDAARQFEADLRGLVATGETNWQGLQQQSEAAIATLKAIQQQVPLLTAAPVESALEAIQAGMALNTDLLTALKQILTDLAEQTSVDKLHHQLQTLRQQIDTAYRQRAELAALPAKQAQLNRVTLEVEQLQQRLGQLQHQLAAEPGLTQTRSHLAHALADLNNPRGRSQLLQQQLEQGLSLKVAHTHAQQRQTAIEAELATITEQLTPFAELDQQVALCKQQRHLHQPGYLAFLQHQKDAEQCPQLEADYQEAITQLQQLETKHTALTTELQLLLVDYDPQAWQALDERYTHLRSQADRLAGGLPEQQKRLAELHHRLQTLQGVAEARDRAVAEQKQREKVRKFITFARKAYKEAGPRITERYVQAISREADHLFRELMNRPNLALEWTRDYEIVVQEGAYSRRLINLSGGEQMCAALAVRLALLRVLADIDVAFFDEPTTNMDRPRRESLAEAIANIRSFRQLFVISHDDTFEKVTENVILVCRE